MTMKKLKRFVSLLSAAVLCTLFPNTNVLTVSAEEPTTYYVKYYDDEWRYQVDKWTEDGEDRSVYYMMQSIKDGDLVVIDCNNSGKKADFEFSTKLSNLTVLQNCTAVIKAPSIDQCYILADSTCAINGDVSEAYVYDDATVTFNNNVKNLRIIEKTDGKEANVTAGGSVSYLVRITSKDKISYEAYNIAPGKLVIEDSDLETDEAYYSKTPTAAPGNNTQASTTTQTTSNTSDEYDEVPKTGESNFALWLLGIAGVCLLGKRALKRV